MSLHHKTRTNLFDFICYSTVKSKLKKDNCNRRRDDNADFSAEELKKSYLEEDQNKQEQTVKGKK